MSTTNHERITFNDIRKGDRLRVRYTDGGREITSNMAFPADLCVSITRTVVAEVEHLALDKAWLDANGHTIVHKNWNDLNIVRLSGERKIVPSRSGEEWTTSELQAVQDWEVPDSIVAERLGRTYHAVVTRRSMLRRQFNRQLFKNRGLASPTKR